MQDAVQEDESLAATFNAYTDARRRLGERFRNRGFWPTSSSKGKGKGSKGRGKSSGKGNFGNRKSLQQRILESNCRHCGRKGHWRAECPERSRSSNAAAANSAPTMTSMTMTSDTTIEGTLPLEFVHLPEIVESTVDVSSPHAAFVSIHGDRVIGNNRKVINIGDKNKEMGKSRIIRRVEERLGFFQLTSVQGVSTQAPLCQVSIRLHQPVSKQCCRSSHKPSQCCTHPQVHLASWIPEQPKP